MRPAISVQYFSWATFFALFLLLALGLIGLHSASSASEGFHALDFQKQLLRIAFGGCVALAALLPGYFFFARCAYALYTLFLGLLVLTFAIGTSLGGSQRWIDLKFTLFQPSEFIKILYVLTLARYLMYRENYRHPTGLIGPLLLTFAPMLLILKQPDLGTALVFLPIFFVMLYAAGAKRKHLLAIVLIGAASMPLMYHFALRDYQRSRIISFLNPEKYSQRESYQTMQSIDAIGSGGFWGKGVGQGAQNTLNFVPEKHNDFIFSVMGEEWGFAGSCLFLLAYLAFLWFCLLIATRTREPFARLTVVGIATLFAVQLLINVGMTVGLMPVTGLPLPLVSYGGSAMISFLGALGIVLNISMRRVLTLREQDDFR